jgi:hypothetical protein
MEKGGEGRGGGVRKGWKKTLHKMKERIIGYKAGKGRLAKLG